MNFIKEQYKRNPFGVILFCGLIVRLFASIFSKGYLMSDDHYLIIEPAQSWVQGGDYNNWLPNGHNAPTGHNFFYVGMHYFFFLIFKFLGLEDPQLKMLVIRLIHGVYSMLVITLGYKIARRITSEKASLTIAWMLALLWFFPNFSVRNLIEFVCIPPILAASLLLMRYEEEKRNKLLLGIGLFLAIAAGIRYQAVFFAVGTGLVFLMRKDIKAAILFSVSWAFVFSATQLTDFFLWGRPFAELVEYFSYNVENATTYFTSPWYNYLLTLGGLLIPPLSIFLIVGYVSNYKKHLSLFLPALLFFAFHSYFPNKQERFILPFAPYLIILGVAGLETIKLKPSLEKLKNFSWKFFWIINLILILPFSAFYSKRAFVESMYYLYKQPDYKSFYYDCSYKSDMSWPPVFYSGKNPGLVYSYDDTDHRMSDVIPNMLANPDFHFPEYILFQDKENMEARLEEFSKLSNTHLELVQTCSPGFIDWVLHTLNHHNKFSEIYVYKVSR